MKNVQTSYAIGIDKRLCAMHRYGMEQIFDIKAEREAKGLSQAEVAQALGVNQSTVARWEANPATVKPFVVKAIKDALNAEASAEPAQ